jgi:fructose-specific component phosphotransferase system IIB-like protein
MLLVHSTILTISASTGKIIVHVAVLLVTSVAKETKVQIINIIIHTGIFSNIAN